MNFRVFRYRRLWAIGLVMLVLLIVGIRLAPPQRQPLQTAVSAIAAQHSGTMGVLIKRLGSDESATLNAEARLRSASLYKLFVLYAAYAQLQAGELARNETLVLSSQAAASDPHVEWSDGTRTSVSCALEAMITISSNAAADMLVERLEGEARITEEMRALGLKQSELTVERAYTSAADIALLLEWIATKQAVNPTASEEDDVHLRRIGT